MPSSNVRWPAVRERITAELGGDGSAAQEFIGLMEEIDQTLIDAQTEDAIIARFLRIAGSGLMQIVQLFAAFRRAPDRSLEGSIAGMGGLAEQLSLRPGGVAVRLEYVGLAAEDFLHPDVTINALMEKSGVYFHIFDLIRLSRGNMFALENIIDPGILDDFQPTGNPKGK